LHEEGRVRQVIVERFGSAVRLVSDLAAISVVGTGINQSFANLRKGSTVLEAAGIAVGGIATSSFRITWMVDRARVDDAVRQLHATFLTTQ
jgi:aspartate kinase